MKAPTPNIGPSIANFLNRPKKVSGTGDTSSQTVTSGAQSRGSATVFAEGSARLGAWPRPAGRLKAQAPSSNQAVQSAPTDAAAARKNAVKRDILRHAARVQTPGVVQRVLDGAKTESVLKGASTFEKSRYRHLRGLVSNFKVSVAPLERGTAKLEMSIATRRGVLSARREEIETEVAHMLRARVSTKESEINALRQIEQYGATPRERRDAGKKIDVKLRSIKALEDGSLQAKEVSRLMDERGLVTMQREIEHLEDEKANLTEKIKDAELLLESRVVLAEAEHANLAALRNRLSMI